MGKRRVKPHYFEPIRKDVFVAYKYYGQNNDNIPSWLQEMGYYFSKSGKLGHYLLYNKEDEAIAMVREGSYIVPNGEGVHIIAETLFESIYKQVNGGRGKSR